MSINYSELLDLAHQASDNSYSPYSLFPVGAALLTEDGNIYQGCNIENSSYSLCFCAERTAVVKAVSSGHLKFKAIAVISKNLNPCNPCGSCLQFLSEFADDMEIILENTDKTPLVKKLSDFLPNRFTPENLKKSSAIFNKS